ILELLVNREAFLQVADRPGVIASAAGEVARAAQRLGPLRGAIGRLWERQKRRAPALTLAQVGPRPPEPLEGAGQTQPGRRVPRAAHEGGRLAQVVVLLLEPAEPGLRGVRAGVPLRLLGPVQEMAGEAPWPALRSPAGPEAVQADLANHREHPETRLV